ncbi:isoprenylcysteine carboxylmethyltransferase family protein [Candidatus Woesearchaeota archaeon]|jgi:protein-S-isoprenylcysteine O-methyltransferase Ste14|nr:isoprenylcysteine carboxylmethyltransferase family protein [Candidatus Woesearchaeota archaeon]MBT6519623.1 isoprenylcysteine carboxylmethyltransferase family protein [Candidatus Woesearchaeota archaeon]MBT7367538.1 isoprenylcysteine carboxylmethyltransferase family protein [Candidatus Woesearchaeota archaeon]
MTEIKEIETFWMFFASFAFIIIATLLDFFIVKNAKLNYLLVGLFAFLFITGAIMRKYLMDLLGKEYSVHVKINQEHTLIKSGPYKYVRHPMYYANTILTLGGVGMLGSGIGIMGILFLLIPTTIFRIIQEERALKEKFGLKYEEYIEETNLIIPGLI